MLKRTALQTHLLYCRKTSNSSELDNETKNSLAITCYVGTEDAMCEIDQSPSFLIGISPRCDIFRFVFVLLVLLF